MDIGKYASRQSIIHSWDIRHKVLILMFLIFSCSFAEKLLTLVIAVSLSLILLLLSKLPVSYILKALLPLFFILFIMLPVLIISSGGKILYSIYFIKIYYEGLILARQILLRSFSIYIIFIILLGSSPFNQITDALKYFRVSQKLISILTFTYRYIFLYLTKLKQLLCSARLRGYKLLGLKSHLRVTGNIMGSLLINSYEQSQMIYDAMIMRGFMLKGKLEYTKKANFTDIGLSSIFFVLCCTIIWIEIS